MTNIETVVQRILDREHMPVPQDIGDGTGLNGAGSQTSVWLQTYGLPFPNSEAEAAVNLVKWLSKTSLLQLVDANLALGDAVSDWAYTSGTRTPIKALQGVLGVTTDGLIGKDTLAALQAHSADLNGFVRDIAKARIAFLGLAATNGQIAPAFIGGELNRALLFL